MKKSKNLFLSIIFLVLVFSSVSAQPPGQWMWIKGTNTSLSPGSFGTIGVASPANFPPGTYEGCEWSDLNGNFWLFPGDTYASLWKYDPVTNQWTWMKGPSTTGAPGVYGTQGIPAPANYPPYRSRTAGTWTDLLGNLWLFGGGDRNDLWKYDISTNQWTWMKGAQTTAQLGVYGAVGVPNIANTPPSRYECAATWTSNSGDLWLFGGCNGGNTPFNDLWRFNIATNTWTWMKGSNLTSQPSVYGIQGVEAPANTPGARMSWGRWKDGDGNFWLMGGGDFTNSRNEMWRFNPTTNNWTWVSGVTTANVAGTYGTKCITAAANMPGARIENRATWVVNGNLWMFGGARTGSVSPSWNDLWEYCVETNKWTWISGDNIADQPSNWGTINVPNINNKPGARGGSMAWKDNNGHLYLYGGFNGSSYNDLWRFTIDPACGTPCLTTIPVAIAASADSSVCDGSCATVSATASNGTPPYSYSWTPNIGGSAGPFSVCPTTTTTYSVTVTDSTGSTATDVVVVTVNTPPPAFLDTTGIITICNASGITLNANAGDYNYVWYHDGVIVQSGSGSSYFANSPGVYQVQVSDLGTGCSSMSQTATIVLGGGPIASIVTGGGCGSILFNGGSITLTGTASNAVSYLWSPGGQTTATIQVTQAGTYCVTAFDVSGCPSDAPACTTVNAVDITCGQHGQKVILCHVPPGNPGNPQTLCIAPSAVPAHIANHPGDCLGPCSLYFPRLSSTAYDDDLSSSFYIAAYPNPFSGTFSLEIFNSTSDVMNVYVYDMLGNVVETDNDVNENTQIGSHLAKGIYFVVAEQGADMQRLRIVKE